MPDKKSKKNEDKAEELKSGEEPDSSDKAVEEKKEASSDKPKFVTVESANEEEKEDKQDTQKESKESPEVVEEDKRMDPEEESTKQASDDETKAVKSVPSSFSLLDVDKPSESEQESVTKDTDRSDEKVHVTDEKSKDETSEAEKKEPEEPTLKESSVSSAEVKDWLSDTPPSVSADSDAKRGLNTKAILGVLVLFAILGAIAGGIYYYRSNIQSLVNFEQEQEIEEVEVIPVDEEEPTPTPEIVLLNEYSVSVLNGSGVAGVASSASNMLSTAGFVDIETGNAESYDYEETQVSMKESVPDSVYEEIVSAFSDDYVVVKSETALDEDSSFDIIIIIGSLSPEDGE